MISIPTDTILTLFPSTQAVYVFGSCGEKSENTESDVDIAILLPHDESKSAGSLAFSDLQFKLEKQLHRRVDLINIRTVSIVFRKEIIVYGERIFCSDEYEADLFETLVLSMYGKLNEERSDILASLKSTGRAYDV